MRSLTTKLFRSSSPVFTFVNECIVADPKGKHQTSDMFQYYMGWAVQCGLTTPGYDNRKKFKELFLMYCKQRNIHVKVVKNNVDYYYGVNLSEEFLQKYTTYYD